MFTPLVQLHTALLIGLLFISGVSLWLRMLILAWLAVFLWRSYRSTKIAPHASSAESFSLDLIRPEESDKQNLSRLTKALHSIKEHEHEARERVDAIISTVQEGLVTLDDQGCIQSANPAALKLFACSSDQFIRSRLLDWLQLDAPKNTDFAQVLPRLLQGEKTLTLNGRRLDGNHFPIAFSIGVLPLNGSEHYVLALKDLSDLLGVHDKLRHSEALQAAILATALDGVITIDDQGIVIEFNPAAEQIFDFSREQAIGSDLADLIIPQAMRTAHKEGMRKYLTTGEHQVLGRRIEVPALHRSGRTFPIELAITPIKHGARTLFTAYVRDISARCQAAEELREAKEQAESASRAKSDFLAVMSHELRTPLNAIIGCISLLCEDQMDSKQSKLLSNASQAGKAMLWLVSDILDFSKIEAGMLELENHELEPSTLVEEVLYLLSSRAQDKGIELSLCIDPQLPVRLMGDAGRIRQVLINLLGNAIKFTEHGGVTLTVTVEDSSYINFQVVDSGIGIPEDIVPRLFIEFMQADSAYSRKYGGTGLGLAISKRLCQMMGGSIGVSSLAGLGSTFWFRLPMSAVAEQSVGIPQGLPEKVQLHEPNAITANALRQQLHYWQVTVEPSGSAEENAWMSWIDPVTGHKSVLVFAQEEVLGSLRLAKPIFPRHLAQALSGQPICNEDSLQVDVPYLLPLRREGRILLAEDSQANQLVAVTMLNQGGYEVDAVANGVEAVAAMVSGKYDLVLMDLSMPEMDGIQATKLIRQSGSAVPILAMTANVLKEDLDRCMQSGMNAYVPKPVSKKDLLDAVEHWLSLSLPVESGEKELWSNADLLSDATLEMLLNDVGQAFPRMVALYVAEARARGEQIASAVERQDLACLRHESHTLKSSSGTLGTVAVQQLAQQIEKACIDADEPRAWQLAGALPALLSASLKALEGWRVDGE